MAQAGRTAGRSQRRGSRSPTLGRRHTERWSGGPRPDHDGVHRVQLRPCPGPIRARLLVPSTSTAGWWPRSTVWASEPYSEIELVKYVDPDLAASDSGARARARRSSCRAFRRAETYVAPAGPGWRRTHSVLQLVAGVAHASTIARRAASGARGRTITMMRSASRRRAPPHWPPGVVVRPIVVDRDLEGVVEVMAAFADHHGDLVLTADRSGTSSRGQRRPPRPRPARPTTPKARARW